MKLGSQYLPLFGCIYSYLAPMYHFCPYLFILCTMLFIYLYLPTFSIIYLYLVILPLISHINHIQFQFQSNQNIIHGYIAFEIMPQFIFCELPQILIRYDFLWTKRVIMSNVQTDSNFCNQLFIWNWANNDQI